jgi:hypothetical protein
MYSADEMLVAGTFLSQLALGVLQYASESSFCDHGFSVGEERHQFLSFGASGGVD